MTSPETPAPNDPSAAADAAPAADEAPAEGRSAAAAAPAPADAEAVPDLPKPPLPWLLAYRVLGLRLPAEYRPWVARDVTSKLFLTWRIARTYLWFLVLIGVVYVGFSAIHQPLSRTRLIQALLITLAVSLLSSGTTLVRRTLRWQRVDRRGRPVRPKGLAVLGNAEAAVAGALVLVLVAAGAGAVGWLFRPTGISAAPCGPPDGATLARLQAGFKKAGTKINDASSVKYQTQEVVIANVRVAGASTDTPGIFVLFSDGRTYEVPIRPDAETLTTFERPPNTLDRGVNAGLQRLAECGGRRRS